MTIVVRSKGAKPPDYIKELQVAVGRSNFFVETEMTAEGSIVTLKWDDTALTAAQKTAALAYATSKGLT